ncbi:Uncharacterised protein [Mycobacterium tuberculosis]|nr:Uncharacterised protein [Mycobacterium tuberculosis]
MPPPQQPVPVPPPPGGTTAAFPPGPGQQWTPGYTAPGYTAPGHPAPGYPQPPQPPRKRSPLLPILGGVAAAAVILAVAGVVFWANRPSSGGTDAKQSPTTVAQPSTPAGQGTGPGTSAPPSPTPSSPASTGSPLPEGLVLGRGAGFTIGVPPGWRRSEQGNSVIWTDPASSAYIQVDQTVWTGDPYDHWANWEREAIADGKLQGYRRVGEITRTEAAGHAAADIEFVWNRAGGTRARDRGMIVNGRPYAIVVAVPASRWNEREPLVKNVLDTFRPSGVG